MSRYKKMMLKKVWYIRNDKQVIEAEVKGFVMYTKSKKTGQPTLMILNKGSGEIEVPTALVYDDKTQAERHARFCIKGTIRSYAKIKKTLTGVRFYFNHEVERTFQRKHVPIKEFS